MARYIDADKIDFSPLEDDFDRARAKVIIMGQPTADVVEVKHSEWVMIPVNGVANYRCGNIDCCRLIPFGQMPSDLPYCPYCGAKMDGGKAE